MTLTLAHALTFADLHSVAGLEKLDAAFMAGLPEELALALRAARATPPTGKAESELLTKLGPEVEDFIARLFGIEAEVQLLQAQHNALAPLYMVKRLFVQRRAAKAFAPAEAATLDVSAFTLPTDELEFARQVALWLADEPANTKNLDRATCYAAWALHAPAGRARHGKGVLFQLPVKTDPTKLVDFVRDDSGCISGSHFRDRRGFALTDQGADLTSALDEVNYCIWCAHQGKDSCSKGLKDKASGAYQKSPHGVTLAGCPLEEKISEFQELKAGGFSLGALAVITVDNPMCAATGHRICNDCMKSCIYQKQEAVDIPQAETRTLKDVLALPWGFEIYALLTRWNPLNFKRPLPLAPSGKSVLVAGLGPAGFTLSHHLMNDGHQVFAIDGLKIEPLPETFINSPIRDVTALYENLDDRIMAGFGGVAEYGITVRWNKNFLKLIRLLLERRSAFAYAGGVRMGGTLTLDDAFAAGFDHVALCMGAGKPTLIEVPGSMARGVRQASDFLMALQLTGAAKKDSLANLELRLPVVVIGGGLTAIDTATEALAYYPVQVEKFLSRYEALGDSVREKWSAEETLVADEFIAHARALRAATSGAERMTLLNSWGGVTLAYRRSITEAPSYTLNHEEIALALEEGIHILDQAVPKAVEVDEYKHACALVVTTPKGERSLPARSILVAAGTQPNTVLARETEGLTLDGKFFAALDENGNRVTPEKLCKPASVQVLMHRCEDGRFVSFFGDLHPSFAGNVVKAMGSAKQGAPVVSRVLSTVTPAQAGVHETMKADMSAHVVRTQRLTSNIVEVVIHAPAAARAFKPGQFYRLQNFETLAQKINGTRMAMEGLALTGAEVRGDEISLIVLEMGGSSSLVMQLTPGEPVILMGPTGAPTHIPTGETVLLIGGGLGNAVLFSIGAACRAAGNKVLYFAGYKKLADRYKVEEIEAAADCIIWCCDEAPGFTPSRPGDFSYTGNMLQALLAYAEGKIGTGGITLAEIDRLIVIGSDRLMGAIAAARLGVLAPHLKPGHIAIGSINSPMQCMMKEICAQCLQKQIDPETGEEKIVFSCFNQDQALERVDFDSLHERLGQNSLAEKVTAAWIARCLATVG
jgi:NADPH-dependent glutamate synthase beta subunit-like oxidoreductase/NAD(P)H-flavin reductase